MNVEMILVIIGYGLLITIGLVIVGSYLLNVYKVIRRLNNRLIDLMTLFRFFGVFFPILGVILGFVKEEKIND